MFREMMKSKLHLGAVTEAEFLYVGSVSIDEDLMDAANLLTNERVTVVNRNNGARFETYVIPAPRGSGSICMNGPAARLTQVGDRVLVISYAMMEDSEARKHKPIVVVLNEKNEPQPYPGEEQHGTTVG